MSESKLSPLRSRQMRTLITQNESHFSDHEEDLAEQDDETKEVAAQLALIRKRHDKTKESNQKKRQYLERLKKDLEKANSVAVLAQADNKNLESKYDELKMNLDQTKKEHNDELQSKKSYMHMLDRMKQDKIAMEMKANALQQSLKSAKQVLDSETDKFRKIREVKYQSRFMLKGLDEEVKFQQKKRSERLTQLERNVKQRQEAALRREERQRRQAEIAEAAANDDKDSHEVKLRDSLYMHRFWYSVLSRKLELEMQKAVDVEQAFQKIRAATGLFNVQDIVERFLTREQTYSQLLTAVADAENKLEELRKQNGIARQQMQGMHLDQGDNSRAMYEEVQKMEAQLAKSYKEYGNQKEKLFKSVRTYDQVLNWGHKIMSTLEIPDELQISTGNHITETKDSLSDMFSLIYDKLEQLVQPIMEREEESRKAIEMYSKKKTEELVAEMSTPEALGKLKRIRHDQKESDVEEPSVRSDNRKRTAKNQNGDIKKQSICQALKYTENIHNIVQKVSKTKT